MPSPALMVPILICVMMFMLMLKSFVLAQVPVHHSRKTPGDQGNESRKSGQ